MKSLVTDAAFSLIGRLFLWSCPAAIVWSIWAIIINAVNRFAFWSWTHVGKKVLEGIAPAIANCDTSCAILLIAFMAFVVASAFHCLPTTILGCRFADIGLTMSRHCFDDNFSLVATARSGHTSAQLVTTNPAYGAAIALRFPISMLIAFTHIRSENEPPGKSLTRQINQPFQLSHT